MSNTGSDQSQPEEFQSVLAVIDQLRRNEKKSAHLLELHTETGTIYVRPSRWQRIRLRRAFRYFHVLPPQLLSRRDQRLIAKLLQSAVTTPDLPVARNAVFGVVEKVRSTSPIAALPEVAVSAEPALPQASAEKRGIPALPPPERQKETQETPWLAKNLEMNDPSLRPWIISAAAAATGMALIMGSVYGVARFSSPEASSGEMRAAQVVATPVQQAANDLPAKALQPSANRRLGMSTVRISSANRPTGKDRVTEGPPGPLPVQHAPALRASQPGSSIRFNPAPVAKVEMASEAISQTDASSKPRFVSEFPQGHFAHPFSSESNLVGELRLKALIGTDGAVKQVTVLSGSPKLAKAGMRAVRQWHYRPYEVNGRPVEVETEIKISFFGPDAVSIASIADRSTSLLR